VTVSIVEYEGKNKQSLEKGDFKTKFSLERKDSDEK
jgi:hypothetical protein